jgi:hypothetical protein
MLMADFLVCSLSLKQLHSLFGISFQIAPSFTAFQEPRWRFLTSGTFPLETCALF